MARDKKVTIIDIAEKSQVSISTVSRVLRGNAGVAEAKKEAVLNAIKALNYEPNVFAQGLASGQSKIIGVLTPFINSPFFGDMMRGIIKGLEDSGYFTLFFDTFWNKDRERQAIQELLARRVDGLIVLAGEIPGDDLCKVQERIPLIIVGRNIPALSEVTIHIDNFQGAYNATKYLIEFGHHQIAHITGLMSHNDAAQRLNGYKQAMLDAGIQPNEQLIITSDYSEKSGLLAVQSLMMRGQTFSAIFCGNDQSAYGARLGLFRQNLRVPDDISLIGFDDQLGAAYTIPPLTTVRQPAMEMGEAAAQGLLQLLKSEELVLPKFKAELVVRETVKRYR